MRDVIIAAETPNPMRKYASNMALKALAALATSRRANEYSAADGYRLCQQVLTLLDAAAIWFHAMIGRTDYPCQAST